MPLRKHGDYTDQAFGMILFLVEVRLSLTSTGLAIGYATEAVSKERAEDFEGALELYKHALASLSKYLNYERDVTSSVLAQKMVSSFV